MLNSISNPKNSSLLLIALAVLFILPAASVYAADWPEMEKLLAGDGTAGDNFGISVSISGDYAVVGAYRDDDKGGESGSAYMFGKGLCPSADLTGDCLVNFEDLAEVAGQWLQDAQ